MKRLMLVSILFVAAICANAQNATQARKVLDKTASVIGRKGGASANFKISSAKIGATSGTIAIKGNKFHARTPEAIVWYDGKTQWSYMKSTEEVNVTSPNEAQQMAMNPYQFINIYKKGYALSMTTTGSAYNVHLKAQNTSRSAQELYILIDKKTYRPTQVKMREGKTWTTINITNFQAKDQPDGVFIFKSKDFPDAEVIDLR